MIIDTELIEVDNLKKAELIWNKMNVSKRIEVYTSIYGTATKRHEVYSKYTFLEQIKSDHLLIANEILKTIQ